MYSVPESVGLIAIADRQTSGKGRGGNVWISPVGCAMFTLHVKVDLHSALGQKLAYLQHIASLAVVEAVRCKPGYEVWQPGNMTSSLFVHMNMTSSVRAS